MNVVDLLLLVGLVYAAARGYRQGALSQVVAFAGATSGLVAGAAFAPRVAREVTTRPGPELALVTLGLLLLAVVVGQAIGVAVGYRLRHAMADTGAATMDRTAGIALGTLGLLLAVWLLGSVLVQGPSRLVARQVRRSVIVTAVGDALPPPPDLFGRAAGYLDRQGFPQVFSGVGNGRIAPPVGEPGQAAVAAAQQAGAPSTVQVLGTGCGGVSSGSGFVTAPGFVVTNAHVVAGSEVLTVRDGGGEHDAVTVYVDPDVDVAVVAVPGVTAPAIGWAADRADRGTEGATLGFPGGQRRLVVKPAAVRSRSQAVGRDIYGQGQVTRQVLTLSAGVQRGDSGGPFVTSDGRVAGVVFAAAAAEPGTGYALAASQVSGDVAAAIADNERTPTGSCRF